MNSEQQGKVLIVIPARGGSKGIPRKNLRPLAGKPMIFYAIDTCKKAVSADRVVVSTDDEEIALFGQRFGASVLMRPANLADDSATLDPVIVHCVRQAEESFGEQYDLVITVQPTSPLLRSSDIDGAVAKFVEDEDLDTVLSVVDDRHLCWTLAEGKPKPAYTARVNRQQLPANLRETGAIIGCRRTQLGKGTRIGSNVALLEMPQERSFDIDNISDLYLCESILNRKRVVFAVVGYPSVGMGHAYRATLLAHEMVQCDIYFVCEEKSALAAEYIASHNYRVLICPDGEMVKAIREVSPDMVINDILDTDASYIRGLKEFGCKVINFEDMGSGYKEADLVINALYPHQVPCDHVLVGPEFFCLRDEFLFISQNRIADDVLRILVTFGGVDEGNLTARVTGLIAPWCLEHGIALDIALGPGFAHEEELDSVVEQYPENLIRIIKKTNRISEFMCQADMAITSGGRTVLELASLEMPTVVICQNRRETTHTFASSDNGIVNLGFHNEIHDEDILKTIQSVVSNQDLRRTMRKKLKNFDLTKGKQKVVQRIMGLLN